MSNIRHRAFFKLTDCTIKMPLEAANALKVIRQAVVDVGLARSKMTDRQWQRWIEALSLLPACAEEVRPPVDGSFAENINDPRIFR